MRALLKTILVAPPFLIYPLLALSLGTSRIAGAIRFWPRRRRLSFART